MLFFFLSIIPYYLFYISNIFINLFRLCTDFKLRSDFANFLSSMLIDCSSENLLEYIIPILEKLQNPGDQDSATMISMLISKNIRKLAIQYKSDDTTNT